MPSWKYDPGFIYPSYDLLPDNYESRYYALDWIYIKNGKLHRKGEGSVEYDDLPDAVKEIARKLLIKGI